MSKGLHGYILVCNKELEARDKKNLCLYLKMGVKEGSPPAERVQREMKRRGSKTGRAKKM